MKLSLLLLGLAVPLVLQEARESSRPTLPEVGKPAPAFRLNHHEGEAVSVGGPQRKWSVVAFFPKAMTPG